MFKRFLLRLKDMKTIKQLITGADEQANLDGEEKPGAEHYVLSALNLEDGSAKRVFDSVGVDATKFREAIKAQYSDALKTIGINQDDEKISATPIKSNRVIHDSQPSGQQLMKSLYAIKQNDKDRPLLGVHVISVASEMEYGVVARAFKVLGVGREQLVKSVKQELSQWGYSPLSLKP